MPIQECLLFPTFASPKKILQACKSSPIQLTSFHSGQMTWMLSLKPLVARFALQSELFAWYNPYSLKNTMANRMTEKNTHIGRPTFIWWSRWSWWSRRTRRPGRPRSPWISLQNSSKKRRKTWMWNGKEKRQSIQSNRGIIPGICSNLNVSYSSAAILKFPHISRVITQDWDCRRELLQE